MNAQCAYGQDCARREWSARAGSFLAVWGAPALVGLAAGVFAPSIAWTAGVWALVLAWMGAACLLNARRCGRLHCYFSGPILLLGAALAAALAGGVLDFGPLGAPFVVVAALALASLTYGLEVIWGRYRR